MEILIRNVNIIDGSGTPAFRGCIGIKNGKLSIFRGTDAPLAHKIIDGSGLTAVPGFIDAHSHGDLTMRSPFAAQSKLSQGITTQIAGQCGISMFPCGDDPTLFRRFVSGISPHPDFPTNISKHCADAASFFSWMDAEFPSISTYSFVGHGTLRIWAMGYADRQPDKSELARMQDMLRRCMRQGAIGLSTGLVYAPCCYADNEELLALLRVVHEEGGFFACHPRNEADFAVESREESIRLAVEANVPLCLSHMKAAGRKNWGRPKRVLKLVDRAVEQGAEILIDTYPYTAGSTALNVSIPPRYFRNGLSGLVAALESPTERAIIREEMSRPSDYENYVLNCDGFSGVYVSGCPTFHDADGMFISEYAEKVGMDPFDAYCDILIRNGGLGVGIYFHMSDRDVLDILRHPLTVLGTDGLVGLPSENPHPRAFATMARAFRLLTTETGSCTQEEAIRKMSGLTAEKLHLNGKGFLKDGFDADLLLIDMDTFTDRATYQHGSISCEGIRAIYHGGRPIREGKVL